MTIPLLHWSDPTFDTMAPGLRARIAQWNEFTAPERLRRYQRDILRTGRFVWPDSITGTQVPCAGTIHMSHKSFLWLFLTPAGPLWLVSGGPSHGYELVGLLPPSGAPFFRFEQFEHGAGAREQLEAIAAARGEPALRPVPAWLLAGHENFAHFIWNELPALVEAESQIHPGVQIHALWEPIAPLTRMIAFSTAPLQASAQPYFQAPNRLYPALLFAAGATRVSRAAKDRIKEVCGTAAPQDPRRFIVWLSLRLTHRHPVDQVEVFTLLLETLADEPYPIEVILDGYSLAADLHILDRHHIHQEHARAGAVIALAAQLKASLSAKAHARLRITDGTRASLPDSIAQAGRADFYICHHGTQQHKIGWIHEIPGVIHAPPSVIRTEPDHWVQNQSEDSLLPVYIPEQFVSEAGPGDYRFTDPAAFVAFVMDHLRRVALSKEGKGKEGLLF